MKPKTNLTEALYEYVLSNGVKEHPILSKLRIETARLPYGQLQIPPEEGQFMAILAKLTNAKKYLEIGVFTGYSALIMALAMGNSSQVIALDNNSEYINFARYFWQEANVSDRITVMVNDALISLEQLVKDKHANSFDIAFIDANKIHYLAYYEYCYNLVRPGGIILIDNVLMRGQVLETKAAKHVRAIQEFNRFIYNDARVEISLLPFADGLTIAYKKDSI